MRIYDIISKKRDKQKLSKAEIDFFVEKYSKGEIPDYQAAALLMAIYINKMDKEMEEISIQIFPYLFKKFTFIIETIY